MRISDWSSDVCSSDLADNPNKWTGYSADIWGWTASDGPGYSKDKYSVNGSPRAFNGYMARGVSAIRDRKSVVEGKSVSVRVDLGGGRIIKKKKAHNKQT